jgi:Flp pilus assembly protein TadD
MNSLPKLREDFRHAECAVGYANLGMFSDALEELETLSPAMSSDAGVQEFKLRLLERASRWQDAAGLAARLASAHPDEPRWFIAWAFAKRRSDSIETASKILTDAASLHPKDPLIQFNLGCYAAQRGDLSSAQNYVRHAIELDHGLEKLAHEDPDLEPLRQAHLLD